MTFILRAGLLLALAIQGAAATAAQSIEPELRWWKGNTHTHSWWSDGDAPPEVIADWYKRRGYQFLVLSDHNVMQQGEKWYSLDKPPRVPEQVRDAYSDYLELLGEDWVEVRTLPDGERQVRLKTLDEFRSLYETPEQFIFIKGEEITDRFQYHPVHINGINLVEMIEPQGGESVVDTIQRTVNAVRAQSAQYGQPMLVHLNHPNFHFAQTPEDFFHLKYRPGEGFFEIYNGHPGVHNHGDTLHQSTERMWDIVLANRLGRLDNGVVYGVATDDAHEYTRWGLGETNPGRGWIMVRSRWLTANKITQAMKRGDFYNSTGVALRELSVGEGRIALEVEAEAGVQYTVEFVGTLRDAELLPQRRKLAHEHEGRSDHLHDEVAAWSDDIGRVLKRVEGTRAEYRATGDEIYVRARVISSKAHPNPHAEGDREMAWTQPLVVER